MEYFVNNNSSGMMYGMGNIPFMATTHDDRGRYISFYTHIDEELDMFEENIEDVVEEIYETESTFSLGFFESEEVMKEVTNLKLPFDSEKDLKGLTYPERLIKVNKVKHFDLYIQPEFDRPDKYSSCWIWVKLPKEIDEIKYVPIIIHRGGGVSVHPFFHKYFLRSFKKDERHVILGFCYVYGPTIEGLCNMHAKKGTDFTDAEVRALNVNALLYKDNEVPKRINFGPDKNTPKRFQSSVDDYYDKMKEIRDLMK